MPSKPGRARTSGTLKPGQAIAKGNDKTATLGVFMLKALQKIKESKTLGEYEEARTQAQAIADDFVNQYWVAQTPMEKKAIFETISDRTEGRPKQAVELGGPNGGPVQIQRVEIEV